MKVRDLIAILNKIDPEMDVRLTMNWEYDGSIGSVYVDDGTLYLDDCSMERSDLEQGYINGEIFYNEVAA